MIKTSVNMNKNKLDEFIRILIPEIKTEEQDIYIESNLKNGVYIVEARKEEKIVTMEYKKIGLDYFDQEEVMVKTSLLKLYGKNYSWGGLIGVRPTKIVRRFLEMGLEYSEIEDILEYIYLVNRKKIDLLIKVVKIEMTYLDNDTIGVYISIPYCPTKCTYCSFPSYLKVGKYAEKYNNYIESLVKEIEQMSQLINEVGLKVNTIYIGGGTPSILSKEDINIIFKAIHNGFNMNFLKELTFEAGRIDTLDKEKLNTLKLWGVNRISINPQSFNQNTLELVNRYHMIDKFNELFEYSKEIGFIINMDLIIGLPKETTEDILRTLRELYKYDIDNLTIHNLAIKKASNLNKEIYVHDNNLDYEYIYDELNTILNKKNLNPYYMYRQKNSYSWGENIGYSKEGLESIYNIEMIEENKTIIGIGAGSITKIIYNQENRAIIERYINPKDPIVWINELDSRMEEKKLRLKEVFI